MRLRSGSVGVRGQRPRGGQWGPGVMDHESLYRKPRAHGVSADPLHEVLTLLQLTSQIVELACRVAQIACELIDGFDLLGDTRGEGLTCG